MPGVVVARVNVSHKFMRDLLDAMEDTWSKWQTTEGIRNLPETDGERALAPRSAHASTIAIRCAIVGWFSSQR